MDLDKFYLVGHSFGGYVAGNYALKYDKHIIKLILLSPLGMKVTSATLENCMSEKDCEHLI